MTELIRTTHLQAHDATRTSDDDPILVCTLGIRVSAVFHDADDASIYRSPFSLIGRPAESVLGKTYRPMPVNGWISCKTAIA